jgi:hypothetical protein
MQFESQRSRSCPNLLYAGFSGDGSYFAAGTTTGFRVFKTDPLALIISKESLSGKKSDQLIDNPGGISCVNILDNSNLFALVAGGKPPK